MSNIRLIARLDIKGSYLVKTIQLEGLRKIGEPNHYARKYYEQGIDEIIYMDIVASLYERNNLLDIVRRTTNDVFVPITVGGGIRTIEDVQEVLRAGADKVAVNTAAVKRPELISEISNRFGSQCMVLSIEAKKKTANQWEAYYDNGREPSGLDVVAWAQQGVERGAGEILLTSVDAEGTGKGFDLELVKAVTAKVTVPVIASGGMGSVADLDKVVKQAGADAVAMAYILHYEKMSLPDIREEAIKRDIRVRRYSYA